MPVGARGVGTHTGRSRCALGSARGTRPAHASTLRGFQNRFEPPQMILAPSLEKATETCRGHHCAMQALRVPLTPVRAPRARVLPPRKGRPLVVTRALPPANEIAGFVIGAGLVGLVFAASRLDGIIAKAQVAGFTDTKGERWSAESRANGGNIFVVPEDTDEEEKGVTKN